VGFFDTPDYARDIFLQGNTLYVADTFGGLRILDVSDPAVPVEMGMFATENVYGVFVQGNTAYLARWNNGLTLVNITNPAAPIESGGLLLPYAQEVYVRGLIAYVANGVGGLTAVYIGDPTSPLPVQTLNTPGDTVGLGGEGEWLVVADGDGGMLLNLLEEIVLDQQLFLPIIAR
jgi:hypothetical protein